MNTYADFLISKSDVIALAEHFGLILTAKEQRIIGIEMLVEEFGTDRNKEISLHDYFEITPNEAYDYCDEIYGGDSQHIRVTANISGQKLNQSNCHKKYKILNREIIMKHLKIILVCAICVGLGQAFDPLLKQISWLAPGTAMFFAGILYASYLNNKT